MCAKLIRCVSLRRFGAFLSALSLCFALCVPAFADEVITGTIRLQFATFYNGSWSFQSYGNVSSGSSKNIDLNLDPLGSRVAWSFLHDYNSTNPNLTAEGVYGIYLSCFYASNSGASQNHAPSSSDFSLAYKSANTGTSSFYPVSSVKLFQPSSSFNSLSDGVTILARLTQSTSNPVSEWRLVNGSYSAPSWTFDAVSGSSLSSTFCITNAQIVSTSSNAELDALESMASNIAEQNQILSQFYGDIVAVCNQIYQRLGDLQAAQEEANRLFSNVISLLNTTNGKIEAINMAMSTYFDLLINQLKQEGIDIRTAIADAEARLEFYLKPMIDYFNELQEQTGESAATLPGHKQDIDGFNNQGFGIDSDGQTGVAALVPILSAFGWIWSIIALFIGVGLIHILVKKGIG